MELWNILNMEKVIYPCVIALVGSGGKTTLMGRLAREGAAHNLRVAVLTTTHIKRTPAYKTSVAPMEKGTVTVFGLPCGEDKLRYLGDTCYEEICSQADLILVEADGSHMLPVKYPAAHEPVIPCNVNRILTVCGMSGLGEPAHKVCHRWNLAQAELVLHELCEGTEGEDEAAAGVEEVPKEACQVTENLLARLLEEGYGKPLQQKYPSADFFYCMNQADTARQKDAAARIIARTGRSGAALSLKDEKNILYSPQPYKLAFIYMASGSGRRYGSNKLLEIIDSKPLYTYGLQQLRRAADKLNTSYQLNMSDEQKESYQKNTTGEATAQQKVEARLFIVSRYDEILHASEQYGAAAVYNPDSAQGITASIHHGIRAAGPADAYLFAVADQPWIKADSIHRLVSEFCASSKTIACLTDGTRNGNPVIFSAEYKEELLNLTGDTGGSVLLKRYPKEVLKVAVEKRELQDIDVSADVTVSKNC